METRSEAHPEAPVQPDPGRGPAAGPKPEHGPQPHPVGIVVNTRPVKLPDHKTTGLAIKEAAIAQGVPIQLDFALFRLAGSSQHPVRDAEEITVHEGQEFRAVAADDNSMPSEQSWR